MWFEANSKPGTCTGDLIFCLVHRRIMASFVDRQSLRDEFERVASHVESDAEARLMSPGVEGIVKLLESITEGEAFGIEEVRHVFEAKEWVESVDVTWSELEALVETLIKNVPKVDKVSIAKKNAANTKATAAESAMGSKVEKDRAESPKPLRDPEALRPAGSSIHGYYMNDKGVNYRTTTAATTIGEDEDENEE